MGLLKRIKQIPEGFKTFIDRVRTEGFAGASLDGVRNMGRKNVEAVKTLGEDIKR